MIQFDNIQDIGIFLGIGLIGAKVGLFDSVHESPVILDDFLKSNDFDSEYLKKWLLSANSYGFVSIKDDKIYCTELGNRFAKKNDNSELANLIQAIFSVFISNESIDYLISGKQPGYSIVNKFDKISPWYNYVNEEKNKVLLLEILSNEEVSLFLNEIKGNVADYSCGNGWFLKSIKKKLFSISLFGVNGIVSNESEIIPQSNEQFFSSNIFYELIILNKVLHHIWSNSELLNNILYKLQPNGKLLIWEFQWSEKIINLQEFKEVVFLNFIEHIQGATYINSDHIVNRFNELGFKCNTISIDNNRQIIYLIRRK